MGQIEVVEYDTQLRDSCLNLLYGVFPSYLDGVTFPWKFERQYGGPPLIVCAIDGDKVVAFNSWVEWKFSNGSNVYRAYQAGDSATHPQYRRMGLFRKVLQLGDQIAMERGIDLLFGFPTKVTERAYYEFGYQRVGTFPFFVRIINPLRRGNGKGSLLTNAVRHPALVQKEKISPVSDKEYYKWRFNEAPREYEVVEFSDHSNEATFVVKKDFYHNKRFKVRAPELVLVDCKFSSLNEQFLKKAFRHLESLFSRRVVWIRTFFNENTDRGKALRPHFPIRLESRFEILMVKAIRKDLDYDLLYNWYNWDIMPHVVDDY